MRCEWSDFEVRVETPLCRASPVLVRESPEVRCAAAEPPLCGCEARLCVQDDDGGVRARLCDKSCRLALHRLDSALGKLWDCGLRWGG